MSIDTRKSYILNNIRLIFRLEEAPKYLLKDQTLYSFLNSPETPLIKACLFEKEVRLYGPLESPSTTQPAIFFMKSGDITEENMLKMIHITSNMPADLFLALKAQLTLLSKAFENPKEALKGLFDDLGLNSSRKEPSKGFPEGKKSLNDLPGSFIEEIDFWSVEASNSNEKVAKKANIVLERYSKIAKPWKEGLKSIEIAGIKDLLLLTWEVFDSLNAEGTHKDLHLQRIILVLGKSLLQKISSEFPIEEIWDLLPRQRLLEGVKSLRVWKEKLEESKGLWGGQGSFLWKEFDDLEVKGLLLRLGEVLEVRSQIEELGRILKDTVRVNGVIKEALGPLKAGNWLEDVEGSTIAWNMAKKGFYKGLEGLENEVVGLLKQEFFTTGDYSSNPFQTMKDLTKYSGLLGRENILKGLGKERTLLLEALRGYSNDMKGDFEARTGQLLGEEGNNEIIPQGHNFSKVINGIIWVRQLSGKLKRVLMVSGNFLEDLEGFHLLKSEIEGVCKGMLEFEKEQFEDWKDEIMRLLSDNNGNLALELSGKLMEFDLKDGLLTINYSERLVLLLREVRQLAELGFRKLIPNKILETVESGKRFYKEALTLKQIAHFYNNMSSQIIPSQKPMVLEQALLFEETVLNSKKGTKKTGLQAISWDNALELEEYIRRVQEASNGLINENKRLRKVHLAIGEILQDLFEVDLLRNRELWKEKLENARRLIESVVMSKDPKLCRTWRTHWDFQLYKIMEFQYQSGLLSLNQDLPEISAEAVLYPGNLVGFRPSLEDLKARYYKELTGFVTLPAKGFIGLGSGTELFKELPQRSAFLLQIVYKKAEELFERVIEIKEILAPWARLGTLQMEDLEARLKKQEDWEHNFKGFRGKRKELEKVPESFKVDCFTISTSGFKNRIDDLLQVLMENLLSSLRGSIRSEALSLEEFVTQALIKLSQKPRSLEEIAASKAAYLELKEKQKVYQRTLISLEEKSKMVRNLAGGSNMPSQANTIKLWENFEFAIKDYDNVLLEQQKEIKEELKRKEEALSNELERFYTRWKALRPKKLAELNEEEAREVAVKVKEWRGLWAELEGKIVDLGKDLEMFGLEKPVFKYFDELKEEILTEEKAWELFDSFETEISGFEKEDWVSFRLKLFTFQDAILIKWTDKIAKLGYKDSITGFLTSRIDALKQAWPLLKLLIGEAFEKDHWKSLFMMLELPRTLSLEKMTFGDLISNIERLLNKGNEIKDLALRAQGEVSLREAITELKAWCDNTEFEMIEHQAGGRGTPLIREWKDLMTKVSDNQALLASLKESKFYSKFNDQIEQFESKMGGIDDYLSKLNLIQRKWVYLDPIFSRGALPMEQPRFKRLDDEYRGIMLSLHRERKVVFLVSIPGVKDSLELILDQLDRCQKALNDFLEEKRTKFSRFYFLGDDDLLEILGQSKNPTVIQMHLKKLYAGIHSVELISENSIIIAMKSASEERVALEEQLYVEEEVENWLGKLTIAMQKTLQGLLRGCLKEKSLELAKYPAQVVCLAEALRFAQNCSNAITSGKLMSYKQDLNQRLQDLTALTRKASALNAFKLKSLILDVIHSIDILDQLISQNIQALHEWAWLKQLRYEMNPNTLCAEILMVSAQFLYTYEYQGNAQKLVHTPLTDKCYLTLTQGMAMGYGGNPYGPAGTGKTESVKALGQAFGRQVLVFNCDEGIDFKSMGRIFIGLIKCGAWGCFDEFNRLLEEQLSAISQQIQVIQWAIKEKLSSLELLGKSIEVNRNSGIFVTMNPAGKGYGGRSKLPDNLKQLFRPVAMSVPDFELIAEVLLYSEGFKTAKSLAQKVVSIFLLAKQLLTQQQHYDWGLRALKTILMVAGELISEERGKIGDKGLDGDQEAVLVIKAIRINTLSKLTYQDMTKFLALLTDVFPGVESGDIVYEELTKAVGEVLKELKLEAIEQQKAKILQFYEATKQRMGVVLVGPSGCGKTTIWKVLKRAHEKLGIAVKTHIINPKSMPRSQLLGNMNNDTREFSEGVLTFSAREVVKEPLEVLSWIVCDGDIDPEWIESLNSVLDDNHLLTLPTGERISFGNNVNFIFETSDLSYASPATISRMGMIFLNNEDISLKSLINEWIKKQTEELQLKLETLIEEYFFKVLDLILPYEEFQVVKTTRVGLVLGSLSQLVLCKTKQEFMVGLLRGFASNFPSYYRSIITKDIFNLFNEKSPDNIKGNPLDFTLQNGSIRPIIAPVNDLKSGFFIDRNEPPIVQTAGIIRDLAILEPWVKKCEPFIVVGPEGCGKNLLIRTAFESLRKEIKIQIAVIHCNAQTLANQIIQKLNQICLKGTFSKGRIYKPKECSRLILYLKDINLPKPDKYQTIQLIAFLQQIIAHRGFYDENLEFVYLDEKIQIIASMNPASTIGRHELSTRFTAKVRILFLDYPSGEELLQVYTSYFSAILSNNPKLRLEGNKIATFFIELYSQILKKFFVDEQRHYLFTPRNLTQIVFELLRYENYDNSEFFYETLYYEVCRSFRDRLVTLEAQMKFEGLVSSLMKSHLKTSTGPSGLFYSSIPGILNKKLNERVNGKSLMRLKREDYIILIEQGLVSYEREYKELKLILLDEILALIAFLDRGLSSNKSLLLAGRSGIGRKTCISLVSLLLNLEPLSPFLTKDYSIRDFRKELKGFLEIAGVQNKPCLLFLEDHHLVQTEFLELINSLISSGEIPGLFTQEEVDHLVSNNAEELRQEAYGKSLYEGFCLRVQNNLHIVLSLDNTHEKFTSNCASNPALYTKCEIIWLEGWSKDSSLQIVESELGPLLKESLHLEKREKEDLSNQVLNVHRDFLTKQASPRHLFSLIETYKRVIEGKLSSRGTKASHLLSGLNKLNEAKGLVDQLSKDATEDKKKLAIKQKEADEALKNITNAMEKAAERKQETEILQKNLQEEEAKIKVAKISIEAELKDIGPVVEEAKKSVGGIQKSHLDELKSLKMPPEAIHDVLNAVLRIFGIFDASWNSMKKFLSNRSIIDSILDFDPRVITAENRREVDKLLAEKGNSFEKHVIYRVSLAAGPLADWVRAIMKYSIVLERIRPLEDELHKILKKLQSQKDRLLQCEGHLKELDEKVTVLKEDFSSRTSEAEILKSHLKKAVEKLDIAMRLLGKLGDEESRWKIQVSNIEAQVKSLPNDGLLAAGFITYLSEDDENGRERQLKDWKGLMKIPNFDFLRFMTSESQVLELKAEGLPGDSLSVENSLIIFNTVKVPLIIDPNIQASEWLRRHLEGEKATGNNGNKSNNNAIELLSQQDPKFMNQLELCVRFGKTLIIQELDYIEPILFPILRKELLHQGPRWVVHIGEKLIDYNPSFRLFLSTRNNYIDIQANSRGLLSIINFTVTKSGLEGKLLSLIINHEQPELERKKMELLTNEEDLKIQLAELEKHLLEELATSSGNILENTSLIENLNQTKEKSKVIESSLEESLQLQANLDLQREVYRDLAIKGASLYMLISDLQKTNNMYRFSLRLYLKIFNKSLDIELNLENQQQKLNYAADNLLKNVYNIIGASLFKSDRLLLGLHIIKGLCPKLFEPQEWELFLGHAITKDSSNGLSSNYPVWGPNERKESFQVLASLFPGLIQGLSLQSEKEWGSWININDCERSFPHKSRLSSFQKVLLIQVFRPDRLESTLNGFVAETLGLSSITGLVWSFKSILKDEPSPDTPILFLTAQGSDPSKELEEFAEREIGRENFQQLSMGGNQNDLALQMLRTASKAGKWLCFKNLHLVTGFLPLLEKELKALTLHENFKLWLTAEPHPKFPAILLESCYKITYEAPPGLKKNLQRNCSGWTPGFFEQGSQTRAQLLFLLAWFHGLLQERRTYIPQGWSKFYEFSYGDFKAGCSIIESLLKDGGESNIQWATLYGLFENAIYGGRIDNEFDMRVLRAYLELYFNNEILFNGKKLSIGVSLPNSKNLKEFTILINKLNDNDNPIVFGLPNNIDKAVQRYNTQQLILSLKVLSRVSSENLKFDKERWGVLLQPTILLWKSLYKQLLEGGGLPKIKASLLNSNDPLDSFVYSEASSAFAMVVKVEESLDNINKVLFGTGILTSDIQHEGMELLLGNVPLKWSGYWEGPSVPLAWLKAFSKKVIQLKKWVKAVEAGGLLTGELNLGDLFRPEVFLNAIRQKTARKVLCPINDMKLVTTFEPERINKSSMVFKVKGLLLQGCGFENGKLVDPGSSLPEFLGLPTGYFAWVSEVEGEPYNTNSLGVFPMFFSGNREKLLTKIKMPVQGIINDRITSGVAFFLCENE